ncbi:hypothetical protein G7Z17_g8239 [Cylindrodendrum hubeiense]|uniref:Geranylgeranyl pyrophosphate synthetase n=1 Tax=Cylindrodendrum hubeiense TaxID=595255 RepID=A0A9P5H5L4_9HYPO|nr:hypothetical protein G7Z17_g8239 [Cylindrodendrum hubeiense]
MTLPALPLGDVIKSVTRESLTDFDQIDRVEISDTKLIASYNWVEDSVPKIMVPAQPQRLSWDSGDYYRDINAASYPSYPLEPAIVSIMTMNPGPMPVNIVACGSTIGNLLRFSTGTDQDRSFRMLVEAIGDTVHLIRRENSPKELIPNVKGFGHTFPEANTTWDGDTKRSTSHQRILKYRFGGLDMMVRFEGDGFIETPRLKQPKRPSIPSPTDDDDCLPDLSDLGVGRPVLGLGTGDGKLKVVEGGQAVPQEAVFDLKTRSVMARNRDTLAEQLHRLWVAQISQFILAYHEKGSFNDVQVKDVKDKVKEWEEMNQPSLKRLAALLHLIIGHARKAADGKLEVVCSGGDSLEIRKQAPGASEALSTSVQAEWTAWLGKIPPAHPSAGWTQEKSSNPQSDSDDDRLDSFSDLYESDEDKDYTACDKEKAAITTTADADGDDDLYIAGGVLIGVSESLTCIYPWKLVPRNGPASAESGTMLWNSVVDVHESCFTWCGSTVPAIVRHEHTSVTPASRLDLGQSCQSAGFSRAIGDAAARLKREPPISQIAAEVRTHSDGTSGTPPLEREGVPDLEFIGLDGGSGARVWGRVSFADGHFGCGSSGPRRGLVGCRWVAGGLLIISRGCESKQPKWQQPSSHRSDEMDG